VGPLLRQGFAVQAQSDCTKNALIKNSLLGIFYFSKQCPA